MARRLLIVPDTLEGGLGAIASDQARWFVRNDWEVGIATATEGNGAGWAEYPIEIPTSARKGAAMLRAARSLRAAIRSFRPDVLHCHGLRSLAVAALAGRRAAVTVHGPGGLPGEPVGSSALRSLGVRGAPLLALRAVTVAPPSDLPGGGARWEFLPHASPRLDSLEKLPFPESDEPLFLWLGRLAAQKRADHFIRAVAEVRRVREIRGVVVGAGSEEFALRRLAAQREAPIEFLGFRDDIEPLLRQAWGVVLLSRFEGLPLALQEAMWTGRPVVASRSAAAEWLVGSTDGLVSTLGEVVEELLRLTDRETAARLGEAAAARVRTLLSPGMPWVDIESAYQTMAEN